MLTRLKTRTDFLRTARAHRLRTPSFILQAHPRDDQQEEIRVGFTCSRHLGNAVTRNRAKRRLREVCHQELIVHAECGWDYVLVGIPKLTVNREFANLRQDLISALRKLHSADRPS